MAECEPGSGLLPSALLPLNLSRSACATGQETMARVRPRRSFVDRHEKDKARSSSDPLRPAPTKKMKFTRLSQSAARVGRF